MKSFILACLVFASSSAFAVGGLSLAAVPTAIDIERSGGFMVYGEFGNVAGCTTSDRMYIQSSHPQYK